MTPSSFHPSLRASTRRLIPALSLIVALAFTSCGGETTSGDEWTVLWSNTVVAVDNATTQETTQEECEDMLGYLRVQRTVLTPVPLPDLETPVDEWFQEAEGIFFDCDLSGEEAAESLLTLEALEGEVDVVLEVEG